MYEVFEPVVAVSPFDTVDEAIMSANATDYCLASYVWAGNVGIAHKVVRGCTRAPCRSTRWATWIRRCQWACRT